MITAASSFYQKHLRELVLFERLRTLGWKTSVIVSSDAVDRLGGQHLIRELKSVYDDSALVLLVAPGKDDDEISLSQLHPASTLTVTFSVENDLSDLVHLLQWIQFDEVRPFLAENAPHFYQEVVRFLKSKKRRTRSSTASGANSFSRPLSTQQDQSPKPESTIGKTFIANSRAASPKVSVCLAISNAEHTLKTLFAALQAQTLENIEILVVDDASNDKTAEIISGYARSDKRIELMRNTTALGDYACFNQCFKRVRGQYVKPLTQDATLYPNALADFSAILDKHADVSLVSTGQPYETSPDSLQKTEGGFIISGPLAVRDVLSGDTNLIGGPDQILFRAANIGSGFDHEFMLLAPADYWLRLLMQGDLFFLHSERSVHLATHGDRNKLLRAQYVDLTAEILIAARKWEPLIAAHSIDEREFIDGAILKVACQLALAEDSGKLRNSLTGRSRQIADADAAVHLASKLIETLGRCQLKGTTGTGISEQIKILEARARGLLNSPSWRVTKTLRDAKYVVSSKLSKVSGHGQVRTADMDLNAVAMSYEVYIPYLEKSISDITSSLSWKLTKPLRLLTSQRES